MKTIFLQLGYSWDLKLSHDVDISEQFFSGEAHFSSKILLLLLLLVLILFSLSRYLVMPLVDIFSLFLEQETKYVCCHSVLGYNPVMTIPAGATEVNITEIRRSKNYLGESLAY